MKSAILAVLLLMSTMAVAQAPQQREPDSPTLQETADYIASHLDYGNFHWSGTTITHTGAHHKEISFDVMDISMAGGVGAMIQANQVEIFCTGGAFCITISPETGPDKTDNSTIWECENAEIRDNVVRALNHFIRLLKQQNTPANDPFGPK